MPESCIRVVYRSSTDASGPGDETAINPRWIVEILDDLRAALDAHGHVTRISHASGAPYQSVKDQLGNAPRHRLALVVFAHAIRDLQRDNPAEALRVAQKLGAELGYTLSLPADDQASEAPLAALARVSAEVGDVARALSDGLPGGLDEDEKRRIDAEAVEAIGALNALRAAVMR